MFLLEYIILSNAVSIPLWVLYKTNINYFKTTIATVWPFCSLSLNWATLTQNTVPENLDFPYFRYAKHWWLLNHQMRKGFPLRFPATEQMHLLTPHESCIRCEGQRMKVVTFQHWEIQNRRQVIIKWGKKRKLLSLLMTNAQWKSSFFKIRDYY